VGPSTGLDVLAKRTESLPVPEFEPRSSSSNYPASYILHASVLYLWTVALCILLLNDGESGAVVAL
jgi:hypothetical protein